MKKAITLLFILISSFAFAQVKPSDEPLKVIQEFVKQSNSLKQTQSSDGVINLLSADCISFDDNGNTESVQQIKKQLDDIIEGAALNPNFTYFIKIDEVIKTFVEGNTAIIICKVVVKYNSGAGIVSQPEIDTFILQKKGEWKIVSMLTTNIAQG
ncbi:MAG: hypothetical protein NT126_05745 [Bacteroidetes bacterium]|nr:hypothetical protein [Bacteroidota bacterium]